MTHTSRRPSHPAGPQKPRYAAALLWQFGALQRAELHRNLFWLLETVHRRSGGRWSSLQHVAQLCRLLVVLRLDCRLQLCLQGHGSPGWALLRWFSVWSRAVLHPGKACCPNASLSLNLSVSGTFPTCSRVRGTSVPYSTSSLRPPGLALLAAAVTGCRRLRRDTLQRELWFFFEYAFRASGVDASPSRPSSPDSRRPHLAQRNAAAVAASCCCLPRNACRCCKPSLPTLPIR